MNIRSSSRDGLSWEDSRFKINWSEDRTSWTIYDRVTKEHHHDILSLGNAVEKAEELAAKLTRIGLVACCKTKLLQRAFAESLYCSDLFQKAASFCRRNYHRWFILSAKYGLVHPTQLVDPYEQTLVGASVVNKKAWAEKVARQLEGRGLLTQLNCFYMHAGQDYAEYLVPLVAHSSKVELPMQGLGIGKQLKFYTRLSGVTL